MPSHEEIAAIKENAAAQLLEIPGVLVVGLGGKQTGGEFTGVASIKICVERKIPAGELAAEHLIPAEIDGVPTDVIETGRFMRAAPKRPGGKKLNGPSSEDLRPAVLIGGVRIRTKDADGVGTLGCFVLKKDNHNVVYALSNYHVVSSGLTVTLVKDETKVGQPSGEDSSKRCCNDIIGKFAAGDMFPPNMSAPNNDRDEALIRLDPGKLWEAGVHEIGDITGLHVLTPAERNSPYPVRKRGARTQLSGGFIVLSDGQQQHAGPNLYVIQPNPAVPPLKPGEILAFDDEGDSGAVMVNDLGPEIKDPSTGKEIIEVVGLVWGRTAGGFGLAFPIENVFERFKTRHNIELELATIFTSPGVQKVPGAPAVAGRPTALTAPAAPPPAGALSGLQRDLDASAAGRRLVTFWLAHNTELSTLVNTDRRVTLIWQRGGAAGAFQQLIRMVSDPDATLPAEVNGRPLDECIDELHQVLVQQGSPRLRVALDEIRQVLWGLGGLTYAQMLNALAERESSHA